jgi:hypothetical protein
VCSQLVQDAERNRLPHVCLATDSDDHTLYFPTEIFHLNCGCWLLEDSVDSTRCTHVCDRGVRHTVPPEQTIGFHALLNTLTLDVWL